MRRVPTCTQHEADQWHPLGNKHAVLWWGAWHRVARKEESFIHVIARVVICRAVAGGPHVVSRGEDGEIVAVGGVCRRQAEGLGGILVGEHVRVAVVAAL